MKTYTLIVLFFFSLSASAQESDTLFYHKRSKLTWDDFAIVPNSSNDSLKSYLSVTIGMRNIKVNVWMGYGTYEAHAMVYRTESWVQEGSRDSSALRHQQYAFALNELVAQQLEKDINDARINLRWTKKIHRIFTNYDKFAKQCLYAYLRETKHGRDVEKQAEWEGMIDRNELKLQIENSRK